jgi:Microtubule binding
MHHHASNTAGPRRLVCIESVRIGAWLVSREARDAQQRNVVVDARNGQPGVPKRAQACGRASSIVPQVEELSAIAERYAETVDENRRLYNEVQDLKGNIRVFCRIRPPGATGDGAPPCAEDGVEGEVAIYNPRTGARKVFRYDRVFGAGADQEAVFEDTKPLIRSVLDGAPAACVCLSVFAGLSVFKEAKPLVRLVLNGAPAETGRSIHLCWHSSSRRLLAVCKSASWRECRNPSMKLRNGATMAVC